MKSFLEVIRTDTAPIPADLLTPSLTNEQFRQNAGRLTIYLSEGLVVPKDSSTQDLVLLDHLDEVQIDQRPNQRVNYEKVDPLAANYISHIRELAEKAAAEVGNDTTAAYHEALLRLKRNDPTVNLVHMI